MEKILFIDRDGTIIEEPPVDYQVDHITKYRFLPNAISTLKYLTQVKGYKLVLVTNQDGLGTESFPEDDFWPIQDHMIDTLKSEGIEFEDIFIDKSFPDENLPTRKPGIGMLTKYINKNYNKENSYVIGDRLSDIELAKNMGIQGIFICPTAHLQGFSLSEQKQNLNIDTSFYTNDLLVCVANNWNNIQNYITQKGRCATIQRNTKETQILVKLNLSGSGISKIETGIGFFDHMLEQIAKHGQVDLEIAVNGDLHIDEHHTVEDTALALGQAFLDALGDKKGINRYGFVLPMDDCLAQVAVDFGGRPWMVWEAEFRRENVGSLPTEMFFHFFKSFSDAALCNLNIKAEGQNEHHKIEAIFKAFAKAIKFAVAIDKNNENSLPSTKGML